MRPLLDALHGAYPTHRFDAMHAPEPITLHQTDLVSPMLSDTRSLSPKDVPKLYRADRLHTGMLASKLNNGA